MNDSLITEAMERKKADPEGFAFTNLSFWKRATSWESRNKWAWVYPDDVEEAMREPIICRSMRHWADQKPTMPINPPSLSLWGIDALCRDLGFKPVFYEVKAGRGAGDSLELYGQYLIVFPTEGDAILYSAHDCVVLT